MKLFVYVSLVWVFLLTSAPADAGQKAHTWVTQIESTYGLPTLETIKVVYVPSGVTGKRARKLLDEALFWEGVTYKEDLAACAEANSKTKVANTKAAIRKHHVPISVVKVEVRCSRR